MACLWRRIALIAGSGQSPKKDYGVCADIRLSQYRMMHGILWSLEIKFRGSIIVH